MWSFPYFAHQSVTFSRASEGPVSIAPARSLRNTICLVVEPFQNPHVHGQTSRNSWTNLGGWEGHGGGGGGGGTGGQSLRRRKASRLSWPPRSRPPYRSSRSSGVESLQRAHLPDRTRAPRGERASLYSTVLCPPLKDNLNEVIGLLGPQASATRAS